MKPSTTLLTTVALLILATCPGKQLPGSDETTGDLQATPEQMQWWCDAKFGLFIHWGPVSLKGTEISWSRAGKHSDGIPSRGTIPPDVYDSLYKNFNPTKFNADEWVALARAAGMKYLVFTTKHHDGFCMFNSRLTTYTIMHSPFARDVVAELAEACHRARLRLGFYYSPPDWHHPDYFTDRHDRYIEYLHGQLRELCTNYGKVDIIWFDGLGRNAKAWDSPRLFKMIRRLQRGVLINNRAGLPGDFDTPEQRIGRFQADRPWESCITLGRQWAWKPNDRIKSLRQCVRTLVNVVGRGGNLLLNVGPMPTGEIEPRQADRLREIGRWLQEYGESIYATRGGPFRPGPWGVSTYKDDKIYLHVLDWDWTEATLLLPPIEKKVVRAWLLGGGDVSVKQSGNALEISVAENDRRQIDTIVVLKLDGPAAEANPAASFTRSLAAGKKARASNVFHNLPAYSPDKALDGDPETRWATDFGVHQAWLEIDLGKPTAFNRALVSEAFGRVRSFELRYKQGDRWRTIARGGRIGEMKALRFEPVTARHVRLNILEATEGPSIRELQLLAPGR